MSLSDKIWRKRTESTGEWKGLLFEDDVKKAIQELKELLTKHFNEPPHDWILEEVDKIFGEELVE